MLHKRFKVAKCKTSLKLASSRIKLMKNKKGMQIIQIKKDLAQLLEAGQERTARIRVEHVIREEKMVAAYELIEIYCELIAARLPIIESQKTCPIDLKEAITSVIFAAPRCSDIPELLDIKKHFTAKYGKDFISGAIELRPDCGVSRLVIEKLSAIAPDVQTKMKVLSAVAKEHNINWDPTSFEEKESKPPEDLLNGPAKYEKTSMTNVDTPSNVQNVHSHEEHQNVPLDFSQQNKRYTVATDTGGNQAPSASNTHDDLRSSGMASERMNVRQSFHSNGNDSSSGRENWNMDFKDATSAAQAAAESAERASMAARAAAHLSSQGKINRQYSTESHVRDERPQVSATSQLPGQHQPKDSYNSSFNDRNPKIQNQQTHPSEHDTKRFSRPVSSRSRNDSVDDPGSSSPETSTKNESKPGFPSHDNESSESAKVDYFVEEVIRKQPSIGSTHSRSSTTSDELDVPVPVPTSGQQKSDKRTVVGNPFAVIDHENVFIETTSARRDDEADSDDDGPRFDTGFEYDEGEAKSFFPSPGRESVVPLQNTHIWSPRRNTSEKIDQVSDPSRLFSERRSLSAHSAKSADPSVNFDQSDGPDSESESEPAMLNLDPEPVKIEVNSRKSRIELTDLVETESQPSVDNVDVLNQSDDSDTGKDLKFGRLTGGLRNKGGLKYPPYTKKSVDQTSERTSFSSKTSRLDNKKPNVSMSSSESDSDDHGDKIPVQSSKTRLRFAPPDAFFNDNGTDSEEEAPPVPKSSTGRVQLGSGVSRRTKGHVDPGGKTVISSSNKATRRAYNNETRPDNTVSSKHEVLRKNPEPEVLNPPKKIVESGKTEASQAWNPSSETSSGANNVKKPSHARPKFPDPVSSKHEAFRKNPEPEVSSPTKKIVESGKTEPSKTSNPSSETSSGANIVKKPSHVHPKLPDYDSLAARIESLRTNRH